MCKYLPFVIFSIKFNAIRTNTNAIKKKKKKQCNPISQERELYLKKIRGESGTIPNIKRRKCFFSEIFI